MQPVLAFPGALLLRASSHARAAADAFDGRSVTFSQPFVDLLKRARSEQRGIGDKLLGVDHIALAICGCTDPHLKGIGELGVVLSAVRPGQYTTADPRPFFAVCLVTSCTPAVHQLCSTFAALAAWQPPDNHICPSAAPLVLCGRAAVATLKVGALRAEAEEEKRRRVAAEAVAHRESERGEWS